MVNAGRLGLAFFWLCSGTALADITTLRPGATPAEDSALRSEGVRLLERAAAVSTPSWPPSESVVSFRFIDSVGGAAREGELHTSVAAPLTRKNEFTLGQYRYVEVYSDGKIAVSRTEAVEPAEIAIARELVPITLVKFDRDDIVRGIDELKKDGRTIRCVRFESVFGERQQTGEACVDAVEGWLTSFQFGGTTIRQSDYFQFAGAWLPAHMERWLGDTLQVQVSQKITARAEYPPEYFKFPEGSAVRSLCREFRRPYSIDTPQPPSRTASSKAVDIKLHGNVGIAGIPEGLVALDSEPAELASVALSIVSNWRFQPATCDGKPIATESDFTVQFKGW